MNSNTIRTQTTWRIIWNISSHVLRSERKAFSHHWSISFQFLQWSAVKGANVEASLLTACWSYVHPSPALLPEKFHYCDHSATDSSRCMEKKTFYHELYIVLEFSPLAWSNCHWMNRMYLICDFWVLLVFSIFTHVNDLIICSNPLLLLSLHQFSLSLLHLLDLPCLDSLHDLWVKEFR